MFKEEEERCILFVLVSIPPVEVVEVPSNLSTLERLPFPTILGNELGGRVSDRNDCLLGIAVPIPVVCPLIRSSCCFKGMF